jgi:hypothetical protein
MGSGTTALRCLLFVLLSIFIRAFPSVGDTHYPESEF